MNRVIHRKCGNLPCRWAGTKKPPTEVGGLRSSAISGQALFLGVIALVIAGIELARPADSIAVGDHLVPVGDPADGSCHREDDGEHVGPLAMPMEDVAVGCG